MKKIAMIFFFVALFVANTGAMEFRWGPMDRESKEKANAKEVIYLSGEIRRGDYERFRIFIRDSLDTYVKSYHRISISSQGGDVVEAIQIGGLIKAMYAEADVPPGETCASACFFVYVSAVKRSIYVTLGVHRAYFDKSYFAGLNPRAAEQKQLQLTDAVESFLKKNSVPISIVDEMNQTSSANIHWLTEKEVGELGTYSPWFEEFLIAKCGLAPTLWQEGDLMLNDEKRYREYIACWDKKIYSGLKTELQKVLSN